MRFAPPVPALLGLAAPFLMAGAVASFTPAAGASEPSRTSARATRTQPQTLTEKGEKGEKATVEAPSGAKTAGAAPATHAPHPSHAHKAKAHLGHAKKKSHLPALPKSDTFTTSTTDTSSTSGAAAAKESHKGTSATPPSNDPPPEVTGSLPQAKIADRKPRESKQKENAKDHDAAATPSHKGEKPASTTDTKAAHPHERGAADAKGVEEKGEATGHGKHPKHDKGSPTASTDTGVRGQGRRAGSVALKRPKARTCVRPAVTFARLGQPNDASFSLTTCAGGVAPEAVESLSVMARPYDVPAPTFLPASTLALNAPQRASRALGHDAKEIAPGVRRIEAGLVHRLQAIADQFPGKTITLVSGYRPASKGSPHASARAFDVRLAGVTNETLVAFCKTMKDTGCGYYPNSAFVHVDVRPEGAGHVSWIDISGPGETPVYVKSWPLPAEERDGDTHVATSEGGGATTDTAQIGEIGEIDGDDHALEVVAN